MNPLVIDVESTTHAKGNPFHHRNQLVCIGYGSNVSWCDIALSSQDKAAIEHAIDDADLLIGFNFKFDLHWLERYGISNWKDKLIWDCQLAQFIIQDQQVRFPSLNGSCEYWGLPGKLDTIKTQFWDNDIDTLEIPKNLLEEYLRQDLAATYSLFLKQTDFLKQKQQKLRLIKLHNKDLLGLQEMEYNGLKFNFEEAKARSAELEKQISGIDAELCSRFGNYPFNFNSGDHLSALLYGGKITFKRSTPYEHTFKSGNRAGQTVTRFKHDEDVVEFPRVFTPLPRSELKKSGLWATDEPTLKQLKGDKKLIQTLLERAKLDKLKTTYYDGFPKMAEEAGWVDGYLHGQYNQAVVGTGRLSSSRPNQQNITEEVNELIESRYL